MLLTHDNVVQALFKQQPCNNLWDLYVCKKISRKIKQLLDEAETKSYNSFVCMPKHKTDEAKLP